LKKLQRPIKVYETIDGFSKAVSFEEIEENDYLLSIPLYVHKTILEENEELLNVNESYERMA